MKISDKEFKEYMALKIREEIRQQEINDLVENVKDTTKWRTNLNTTRGYASVFANILYKEWEKRGNPEYFVLDRWSRVKKYIPDFLMEKKKGKWYLKPYFRECLKDYGFRIKIDRKYGLFEIIRII